MSHPTCHACGFIIERDVVSCPYCGRDPNVASDERVFDGPSPSLRTPFDTAGNGAAFHGRPVAVDVRDGWFGHFLRFAGALTLVIIGHMAIVGLLWSAGILNRTGYRRRDVVLLLVPIIGSVLVVITVWRYTAKSAYWSGRADAPSQPLSASMRPTVIGGGWVALAGLVALVGLTGTTAPAPQAGATARAIEYAVGSGEREFVASDAQFGATFPQMPQRLEEPLDPAAPAGTITHYVAEISDAAFSVSSFAIGADDLFDLDLAANGAAAALEGRLEASTRTSLAGHEAVEYVVAAPNGIYVKAIVARTPTRVYQVQVGGLGNPPTGYAEFVQSFHITASPTAVPA